MYRHHAPRRTMTVAAVRHRHRHRAITLFMLLALLTVAGVLFFVNKGNPRMSRTETHVRYSSVDVPSAPWVMPEPLETPIARATHQPASTKAEAPGLDWSALSLGVSDAQAAVLAPATGSEAASPAEINVALSREERGRLIAAARDAESGPAPAGYRPGIATLVPAGSGDGICR